MKVYNLILLGFTIMFTIACARTVEVPDDYPEEDPVGFCYDYDKDTRQCYLKDRVCYLYFAKGANHMICSRR